MHETLISIEGLDPVVLLGNENSNLRALQDKFPKLRIVARGNDFIIKGGLKINMLLLCVLSWL